MQQEERPLAEDIPDSEVVRILKKKNKSPKDLVMLDVKFEKIKFFSEFRDKIDEESFYRLLKSLQYEKIRAHQSLFRYGDRGHKFYIILTGSVSVMLNKDKKDIVNNTFQERRKLQKLFNESNTNDAIRTVSGVSLTQKKIHTSPKKVSNLGSVAFLAGIEKKLRVKKQDMLTPGIKEEEHENVFEDEDVLEDDKPVERMKMSRPLVKLAYSIVFNLHETIRLDQNYREDIKLANNDIFRDYNVCFWQNKLLRHIRKDIDMDLLKYLYPIWKEVLQINEGGSFGEIALLQKCTRKAGIYCTVDCEFATISKKNESDFEYLIRWEQRAVEVFMRSFDVFNYWAQKNQLSTLVHYMTKNSRKIIGDYVYKKGEKVKNIFFLKSGLVEITHKRDKPKKFEIQGEDLIINNKVFFIINNKIRDRITPKKSALDV